MRTEDLVACTRCDGPLDEVVPGWCPACGRAERVPAQALVDWLLPGATPLDLDTPSDPDPLAWPDYAAQRTAARERTGSDESVLVVRGPLAGEDAEVVAVVWEFGFLGGSMGSAAGQRIAAAYDAARAADLPVLLLTSTGGARMQEGMASLVQMAATTAAQHAHARAGLLQVAVLRDPTTGGVFASHANLADVVLAEAGATIGFAGPRVAEAVTDGPLPSGSHTARGAEAAGLVDAVVRRPELPTVLAPLLRWAAAAHTFAPQHRRTSADDPALEPQRRQTGADEDAWLEVQRARAEDRARAPAFLAAIDVAIRLRGDRAGGTDGAITVACAHWDGHPVVVLAMDPGGGAIGPAGYRTAWRGLELAERLGIPVVTLVDTPGADASAPSEAGGVAHHIAATFARLLDVEAPVVSLVVGEGGSGGALALAVGDRLLIQEHAMFSVIAPEGAAAILHRDRDRAPEVTALLDPTARRLQALGIADEVVPEPSGDEIATAVAAVTRHLDDLIGGPTPAADRHRRWRRPLR